MTGAVIALAIILALALVGVWVWRSSTRHVPSDETLRHPRPQVAEPLIRGESRHHDTPGAADVGIKSGREHNRTR